MLLAEIHGKHAEAIEANEDYLTSAVFGHLRHVRKSAFWRGLFEKAKSADGSATDLMSELLEAGITFEEDCEPTVLFWPRTPYGEPDLLLSFRNPSSRPLVLVIEVKLFSMKSSSGAKDQLCEILTAPS